MSPEDEIGNGGGARLTVGDLMTPRVCSVDATTSVSELRALMRLHRIHHLPVLAADGSLLGLVSHRDLRTRDGAPQADTGTPLVASRVMTSPIEAVEPRLGIQRAAEIMLEGRFGCLPVVDQGRLVGILTESDFVRLLSRDAG